MATVGYITMSLTIFEWVLMAGRQLHLQYEIRAGSIHLVLFSLIVVHEWHLMDLMDIYLCCTVQFCLPLSSL